MSDTDEHPVKRGENGQFLPGTAGGPGRPEGSVSLLAVVRRKLRDEPERLEEIAEDLLLMARARDPAALRAILALLDRLDGPVAHRVELGEGDVEFRVVFPKPATAEVSDDTDRSEQVDESQDTPTD